ncbi:Flagellar hook protein flgE [Listeria grayi]|uniref:Flagellar hook protein FlgE n=1 Tax=Listeria grayi TaxID=1641 RepID=A0A378MEN3_LISGR|nr:flagellar hook protein FlgE [Listeria grayi]STY43956.1 Flagellar hook protein flgE [Listeria grayi]
MNQTMYTAISGMNAFQQALSVTSNNIANANTTGYKRQSVVFNDLLYQNTLGSVTSGLYAGTNPMSFGSGTKIGAVITDYTAGSPTATGRNKDAALQGNGFFIAGDRSGGNAVYTRDGSFAVSSDNFLTTQSGKYVMGYATDKNGNVIAGNLRPIQIPLNSAIPGEATKNAKLSGNIPTDWKGKDTLTSEISVYDDAGGSHKLQVELKDGTRAADGSISYSYELKIDGNALTPARTGALNYNAQGELTNAAALENINVNQTIQGKNVSFDFDLSKMTNYETEQVFSPSSDGKGAATVKDFAVTDAGYIAVSYSDGTIIPVAQLGVATFSNVDGLVKNGNGEYTPGLSSGDPVFGVAGQNGAGGISGASLEGSNVDLSQEFVNLMTYQSGFQGNTKVIRVADDVMKQIVNLIQ